jgi:hypothetical protein
VRIGAVVLLAAATHALHRGIPNPPKSEQDERFVPRPEFARAISLGFEAVVADYYWLQAVQVVGGTRVNPGQHARLLGRLVDVTTTVDPWVDHPYRFAAVWLTQSEDVVREANRLIRRGIAYHPDDWRNHFYLGFNHFFYLEENEQAAAALEAAIELEGSPRYLRRLVARLRADRDGLEPAAVFLQELVRTAQDPYARAEYEKALDEVETERRARGLDRARAEYKKRNGRDIERVEDLATGPSPVLRRLPRELHGWEWELDEEGRIVSSYYGRRYELNFHETDQARRKAWREQGNALRAERETGT